MKPHPPEIDAALRRCAEEPIHIPGAIQGGGTLWAAQGDGPPDNMPDNMIVAYAAGGGARPGGTLREALDADALAALATLTADNPDGRQIFRTLPLPAVTGCGPRLLTAHRHRGFLIVEIEAEEAAGKTAGHETSADDGADFARAAAAARSIYEAAALTVKRAAALTGYDRCMVYRFLPDWSGDVIAETRPDEMPPYLGLRYPASDIPEQARRLYVDNILRIVADVDAPTAPLLSAAGDGAPPLDLGRAVLRAVSPVHLQYLRNMRVAATLTGSIIVDGRLWGLLACHHRSPRRPAAALRPAFIAVVDAAAAAVARLEAERKTASARRAAGRLERIRKIIDRADDNVALRLCTDDPGLADLTAAEGAALIVDGRVLSFGVSPGVDAVRALAHRLETRLTDGEIFVTDHLRGEDVAAGLDLSPAAGVAALRLRAGDGRTLTLAAFRGELVREVFWGGDPDKPLSADGDRLSPRVSFDLWRETVTGRSREWDEDDLAGWRRLPELTDNDDATAAFIARIARDIDRLTDDADWRDPLVRSCVNAVAHPSVVVRHDAQSPTGRTPAANRAFRAAFNLTVDDIEETPFPALLRMLGFDADAVTALPAGAALDAAVTAAGVGDRWFTIRRRPLLCVGVGMTESALSLWSLEDTTGFRRVEDALRAARLKAEATDRAKSAFLANVSHELRTPLNAIIGFSEMMAEEIFGGLGNQRYRDYAEHINTSGRHLLSLIGDVLDATRIERGGHVLHEEDFDLADLFRSCCAMTERAAAERGLTLTVEVAPKSVLLRGDPRAVRQILLNLMTNAVKYTPSGGSVHCRLRGFPGDPAEIGVSDNGVGIAEEHRLLVFEPYYQTAGDLTSTAGGMGLGLALVKVLAQLHGGRVDLQSRLGAGTTVRVQFPLWRSLNPCQPVADDGVS